MALLPLIGLYAGSAGLARLTAPVVRAATGLLVSGRSAVRIRSPAQFISRSEAHFLVVRRIASRGRGTSDPFHERDISSRTTVIGKVLPDRPLSLAICKGRPRRDAHDRPLEPAAGGTGQHSAGHGAQIVAPMTHVASPLVRRDDLGRCYQRQYRGGERRVSAWHPSP
jgi:hypothetical protein